MNDYCQWPEGPKNTRSTQDNVAKVVLIHNYRTFDSPVGKQAVTVDCTWSCILIQVDTTTQSPILSHRSAVHLLPSVDCRRPTGNLNTMQGNK